MENSKNQVPYEVLNEIKNQHVKCKMNTYEEYLQSVKLDRDAINHVPQNFLTKELYIESVKHDGTSLRNMIIVRQIHNKIKYFPKQLVDHNIFMEAVTQNEEAILYVPCHLLSKQICDIVIAKNESIMRYIPKTKLKEFGYLENSNTDSSESVCSDELIFDF